MCFVAGPTNKMLMLYVIFALTVMTHKNKELLNEHLDFIHYFGDLMSNSSAELSDLLLELILTKLLSVYAYLGCSFSFSKTRNSG